jgi:hypothetical protein
MTKKAKKPPKQAKKKKRSVRGSSVVDKRKAKGSKVSKKKATCEQVVGRTAKGQFAKGVSGNPSGGALSQWRSELEDAINTVQKRKRKKLMVHAVEQSYKDNKVLIAILKKILPDLKIEEVDLNASESLNSFIDWLVGRNGDPQEQS